MSAAAIGVTGNNVPVSLYQPYLVLRYCVALAGIYPSRN
jgi:microcystin-dependent protein